MAVDYKYPGEELELFESAKNWKRYFSNEIKKYIRGNVLEVGAGLGANTRHLNADPSLLWTLLEPDATLFSRLESSRLEGRLPTNCMLVNGTIENLPDRESFDAILYIDVIEHIEDDRREFMNAAGRLKPGGSLVILAPAFPFLYSPFDKAVGHYRRYNKQMMRALGADLLNTAHLKYLDSLGCIASVANKLLLRQELPSKGQVRLWDSYMVPVSRIMDRVFFNSFGKSILGIWTKQ